ncbi:uncharacterized protein LOC119768987 [Culex quinquefasciatus]|uniref:uncharacterized protein LOC119768987 n=1 Tax=Culex quinquefasciatus TaxID=7176 RepID=UPI0018E34F9C|nr:uncharacterized protein LOC119768987 [Culex quinquefasciatus]
MLRRYYTTSISVFDGGCLPPTPTTRIGLFYHQAFVRCSRGSGVPVPYLLLGTSWPSSGRAAVVTFPASRISVPYGGQSSPGAITVNEISPLGATGFVEARSADSDNKGRRLPQEGSATPARPCLAVSSTATTTAVNRYSAATKTPPPPRDFRRHSRGRSCDRPTQRRTPKAFNPGELLLELRYVCP